MAGRGSKPGERRGGRQKGTPNKINAALKDMILGALDELGGQKYLVRQARRNPTAFMTLLGKVLPMQLTGGDGNEPLPCFTVRFVDHAGNDITEEMERKRAGGPGTPEKPAAPEAPSPGPSREPAKPPQTPRPPWLN